MIKSLTMSSVAGLLLGFALLAWLRPNTSEGSVATVVFATLLCVGFGGLVRLFRRQA